jgi:hypothetical protein
MGNSRPLFGGHRRLLPRTSASDPTECVYEYLPNPNQHLLTTIKENRLHCLAPPTLNRTSSLLTPKPITMTIAVESITVPATSSVDFGAVISNVDVEHLTGKTICSGDERVN